MIETKAYIHGRIQATGFFNTDEILWLTPDGKQAGWTFDLKALFLDKEFLDAVCIEFWKVYDRTKPIQICGLESASIPLVTALVLSGEHATGLYIRKSKKKKYDLREVEGEFTDAPIVIVDDIVNLGTSIEKQIKALKKHSRDVHGVFACVHLQPLSYYSYLIEGYGIAPKFLFSVTDFGETYSAPYVPELRFSELWSFRIPSTHEFNVTQRDQMCSSSHSIYLNADDGFVYAMSRKTGDIYWKTRVQKNVPVSGNQPGICCGSEMVYVPTENGALFILSERDGSIIYKASLLDHMYGTPLLFSEEHKLILRGRQGRDNALIIFDLQKQRISFEQRSVSKFTSCVRGAIPGSFLTTVGSGEIISFELGTAKKRWQVSVNGILNDGVAVDVTKNEGFVVTDDGYIHTLNLRNGKIVHSRKITDEPFFFARPVVYGENLYVTSLHRTLYCVNRYSGEMEWEFNTRGRIFGSPVVVDDVVFFGNNEGILFAVDAVTGKLLGNHVVGDRIVSMPVRSGDTELTVATIGNQLFTLSYTQTKS